MEAKVTWVEDRRFVGQSPSGHAIVVDGNQTFLYKYVSIAGDNHQFEKVAIRTGIESDGYVELKEYQDISAKDEIVINGAFYLLNIAQN